MRDGKCELLLAFYPHARGFAYVTFEGPSPVDWGMSDSPRGSRLPHARDRLETLLARYKPDAIIVREISEPADSSEAARCLAMIRDLAMLRAIPVVAISRKQIRSSFGRHGPPARNAIARAIATRIPALAHLLPPPRKIWNGEDRRMGLFDAIALVLAFTQADLPAISRR